MKGRRRTPAPYVFSLEFRVRPVAERAVAGRFAATEKDFLAFFGGIFLWVHAGVLVRSIAERLVRGMPAGAPEIGFPGFDFDGIGGLLGDFWGCHGGSPFRAGFGVQAILAMSGPE